MTRGLWFIADAATVGQIPLETRAAETRCRMVYGFGSQRWGSGSSSSSDPLVRLLFQREARTRLASLKHYLGKRWRAVRASVASLESGLIRIHCGAEYGG